VVYGLIKDIKDYHTQVCSSSNSSIEKIYDGLIVSPVIVAGEFWLLLVNDSEYNQSARQ
jgi:hypothetical protein